VFAVAENGDLLWHRYNGTGVADPNGATGWHPNSGNPIGNGWQGFRQLYGGISDEGGTIGHVIYGVTTDGDVLLNRTPKRKPRDTVRPRYHRRRHQWLRHRARSLRP
jgi:hypothetical protein